MARFKAREDVPDAIAADNPGSAYLLWPNARRGPWLLRVHWTRVDERLECCGVELKSFRETGEAWPAELPTWDEEPEVLTARTLRQVPLGAILHDLREEGWRQTLDLAQSVADPADGESLEIADGLRRMARRNRGRRPRGIAPLSEVAAVYIAAQQRRDNPTEAIGRHWRIAHSTAAKWVMRARGEGHLPPSGRQRTSGR